MVVLTIVARNRFSPNIKDLPSALRAVRTGTYRALARYRPRFYDGTVSLIRSDIENPWECNPVINWTGRSRQLQIHNVTCDHLGMVRPPGSDFVARALSEGLAAAKLSASDAAPLEQKLN